MTNLFHKKRRTSRIFSAVLALCITATVLPLPRSHAADIETAGATTATTEPVSTTQTTRSFYTDEKVAAARENILKYKWAQEVRDKAVADADVYVDKAEQLWKMVTPQSLPRGITIAYINDPEAYKCPYCGTDLRAKYSSYPWITDPINDPWKIQCPDCKRKFPSNDFGKYYESGLDEHGIFVPEKADKKLLTNDLYPEKGPGWGVDDGFGYDTGKTFTNAGTTNKSMRTFISYYIHYGLWFKSGTNPGVLITALSNLRDAYLYTGDIKYGRTGAILLDRIADLYPTYTLAPYKNFFNSHGMRYEGKAIGKIWETFNATDLAKDVDAFRPAMSDPQVIEFLSKKAETYKLDNKKSDAASIIENSETGILREIYKGFKNGRINGNFGMHQQSLTLAAVVLNKMPETKEWIDYVFQPGEYIGEAPNASCTGGDVNPTLVNKVDRDGFGNEAAPGYNKLWVTNMLGVANALDGYKLYPKADLYKNPKFKKMFSAIAPLIMCSRYTPEIGDSGSTAGVGIVGNLSDIMLGYYKIGTDTLAQYAYALNKVFDANSKTSQDDRDNQFGGLKMDIFTKNPEAVRDKILSVIKEKGELAPDSINLEGFGFAALRDGNQNANGLDTQRAFSLYYGRNSGHGHSDMLNLGVYAYGLNLAPDLGYPEATGMDPNRFQWVLNTISHNTVSVNAKQQNYIYDGTPKHFDNAGNVQVIDVDSPKAYDSTSIYRRSVVMVKVNDDVSYGVDFFRVKGGDDHLYSFHAQSNEIAGTDGLNLVAQKDSKGNYIGTYEGADVEWGVAAAKDPNAPTAIESARMASGFTWLSNIDKDKNPSNTFSVDWKIKDFRNVFPDRTGLHLRLTSLNDAKVDDVTIANGIAPRVKGNPTDPMKYLLIRRQGTNLDSMFTSVLEPYMNERYIDKIELVSMSTTDNAGADDIAKAVKVTMKDGRVDYIMYATNNNLLYKVDNKFDFRGFTGVYSEKNGKQVYSYINDGDVIGTNKNTVAYTGTVTDFTKDLSDQNSITVKFDSQPNERQLADLKNRFIYIANDGVQNAAYKILGAKIVNGNTVLDVGDCTTIKSYAEKSNSEYKYIFDAGQSFRIPLSKMFGQTANGGRFKDLENYSWAKDSIETLAAQGIINGTGIDTYSPGVNITRGDFVTLIMRAIGLKADVTSNFSDVSKNDYYYNELGTAKKLGIITGVGNNKFNPKQSISRQDMMVITTRVLELAGVPLTPAKVSDLKGYSDVSNISTYAENDVATLVKSGIVGGSNGKINPLGYTTRAEVAVMLYRVVNMK